MRNQRKNIVAKEPVALLLAMIWTMCACLPAVAEENKAKGAKEAQSVSATAIVEGCEIEGKITQAEFDPKRGRWAPLRAVIKMRNVSDEGRKISFFCQIISQDSNNNSDAFVFSEGTYEMSIAPRETIVRDFPFIDLKASMPSGYLKDTVAIRIGRKPFKRYGDHIPIKPDEKLEVGEDPVTIAVRAGRGAGEPECKNKPPSGIIKQYGEKGWSQVASHETVAIWQHSTAQRSFVVTKGEDIVAVIPTDADNDWVDVYLDNQPTLTVSRKDKTILGKRDLSWKFKGEGTIVKAKKATLAAANPQANSIPESIRNYTARQQALPHVTEVKTEEFKDDVLLKLFAGAGIRSFHVVSTFDTKHAKLRGAPTEAKRFYVLNGEEGIYTAFDRKDMISLARRESLSLNTPDRRKWFAGQVSGPLILAVEKKNNGTWLIHYSFSGRIGGGVDVLELDEKMVPVSVKSPPKLDFCRFYVGSDCLSQ